MRPVDVTPPEFAGVENTRDLGGCEVEVSWDETTASDACSGVAGYDVHRDSGVAHAGETLVASGVPGSPYVDTTPGNGTWVYVVRAVDAAGNDDPNEVFEQQHEGSCTNDFPRDAGKDREDGIDPPNADGGHASPVEGGGAPRDWRSDPGRRGEVERPILRPMTHGAMTISWKPSPDEGGLHEVTYAVVRGDLLALGERGHSHELVEPGACGIEGHELVMEAQLDGPAWYDLVVPVSGDNATFGYDSFGEEREEVAVCE